MDVTKVLPLIAAACVAGFPKARAEDLCPAGPFETNVQAIAAAIASEPLKPVAWYAERAASVTMQREPLTDGAVASGGGGFLSHSDASIEYDATRYVLVNVIREWPAPSSFESARPRHTKPIPNQVIQKVGDVTYTTTIARPTPEDAREFACLANQLLVPPRKEPRTEPTPASPEPHLNPNGVPEVTISVTRRRVCSREFTDEHWESFQVLTSKPGLIYNEYLSCTVQQDLESHIREVIYEPINDVIAQGEGTWEPPRVHSLTTDAAGNLYLLVDPGTHRHHNIDVRKVTPTGDVMRLSTSTGERFYGHSFAVDGQGHVWVPMIEGTGTVIYGLAPDGHPGITASSRPFGELLPSNRRACIETIAVDSNNNLYAMSGSEIFEITPAGAVLQLADADIRHQSVVGGYLHEQFQITVAPDGTLFITDSARNVVLKRTPNGVFGIVAGTPDKAGAVDGRADKALFSAPKGLALDREGNLYIADSGNHTIRRITPGGVVSTFAGAHGKRGSADGHGTSARFDSPASITVDSTGTLYVANGADNRIRKISPAGVVSTVNAQRFIDTQ